MNKKEQRQGLRRAAKWLLGLTNDMDWGTRVWDDLEQKPVPKHRSTKELLLAFLSGSPFAYPRRLSQRALIKHFLGEETVYFTGSRGDETLVMLDVDCHKSGSLEGASRFAEFLKLNFFPDLYCETSTNGNGIHGYVLVDKRDWSAADYNGVLKLVEKWLKQVLATTGFDVETVELKGRCPSVVWGSDYKRQVSRFTMGGLAKMPRDATRFEEWQATTRLTAHDLRKLPELHPVADTVEVKKSVKKQDAAASVRGKLIDRDMFRRYLPLAQRFVPTPEPVSADSRVLVTAEDAAIFLVLLEFFSDNPNPDGSMPSRRFETLWKKLYLDGDVTRCFDNKRFAFVRNRVSKMGGIEWEDATYSMGVGDKKGTAAKWKASSQLRELMREYGESRAGSEVGGAGLEGSGDVLLSVNNNKQRKLSGNSPVTMESLWAKMPIANRQNVGLRPVMVTTGSEKWVLADHLDGLEALGLSWMAA